MKTREIFRKIFQAKEALLVIERKITELPYPPVNAGVQLHVLEVLTSVRFMALEIDQIYIKMELLSRDLERVVKELKGIRGAVNTVLWWRKERVLRELNTLAQLEESFDDLLDSHRGMIPLFEERLSILD